MTDRTVMAEGERVVRRYPCTAVDRVALILGTVIPLPGSVESEGVLTVTNRRVIFEIEAGEGAAVHRQETSLSSISSVSSMMSSSLSSGARKVSTSSRGRGPPVYTAW